MVQGRGHVKVILSVMALQHLEGALQEFLCLFVVFEVSVGDAHVIQSACHHKMVLSVVPFLYLEAALVHFFGFAIVFEVIVGDAQVIQSDTNFVKES